MTSPTIIGNRRNPILPRLFPLFSVDDAYFPLCITQGLCTGPGFLVVDQHTVRTISTRTKTLGVFTSPLYLITDNTILITQVLA